MASKVSFQEDFWAQQLDPKAVVGHVSVLAVSRRQVPLLNSSGNTVAVLYQVMCCDSINSRDVKKGWNIMTLKI